MKVRFRMLLGIAVVTAALTSGAWVITSAAAEERARAGAQSEPSPRPARADAVLKGDATCTGCHDESETHPVFAIGKTRHGVMADERTPTCTSCHGASPTHVRKPPGMQERPAPDVAFKGTSTPVEARNGMCLGCHQGGQRIHWASSAHATREVSCTSCHQIHAADDAVRVRRTQPEVCFTCHKEQRAQIHRPFRHPVLEGKVACSDCHNPHGSAGVKLLARDSVVDTCYACHMEKRGPFVRTHQPVTEDCTLCHNPHGTTIASLLKQRPPFLCQQCHEPTSHRGGIASIAATGFGTSQNTLARGCMNCHTNIHGTNNPRDIANERTFRR
jgi:DmsE family decaheme c-type cytochrome